MKRLLCGLLALTAAGAAELGDNAFEAVDGTVVTPHVEWARPLAGGAVRMLVVAPAWSQRETVELAQRFELTPEVVMCRTHRQFAGEESYLTPDKCAARFDQALSRDQDVIIVGGFDWQALLLEHRAGMLRKVFGGAGLVYVSPPKNDELAQLWAKGPVGVPPEVTAGVPWARLTAFAGQRPEQVVQAGNFGRGRWVRLDYPTNSTNQSLTPRLVPCPAAWEYDHYLNLVGRAALWAAGREPRGVTLSVGPGGRVTAAAPGAARLKWSFQRLPDGVELPGGERAAGGELPTEALPTGEYAVVVRALDPRGAALDWAAAMVNVDRGLGVTSLAFDQEHLERGEPVRAEAVLTRPLKAGERVRFRFSGPLGRLLAESEVTSGGRARFEHPGVAPLGGSLHRLTAEVLAGESVLARAEATCAIRGRARPAFHLAVWEEPETDRISALSYHALRGLGVDAVFYRADRGLREDAARLLATADLWGAPSIPMYNPKPQPGPLGPVHPYSLFDPLWRQEARQKALASATPFAPYGVLFYPTGSDVSMHGNSFDEHTLRALRLWLTERYGGLDQLNRLWGTAFRQWDEVVPDSFDQARQTKRFVSWVEHTRFMETGYAGLQEELTDALRTIDPEPLFGQDGYGRLDSTDGADWWRLLGSSGFYNLYTYQDPPQMEITRSLVRDFPGVKLRSLYYGSYTGQYANHRFMRWLPWYAVLHDYNGLFWWCANGKSTYPGITGPLLGPDFRPTRTFRTSQTEIEAIRSGWTELAAAGRPQAAVAIYHDQTAVHAVTAYSHPSRLVQNLAAWQALLSDLGLPYDYLAAPQVAAGRLTQGGYRLLILAHALAIDEPTLKAIRAFQAAGGTVLADVAPAGYDEYLRPLPQPGLAQVARFEDGLAAYAHEREPRKRLDTRRKLAEVLDPLGLPRPVRLTGANADDPGLEPVELVVYAVGDALLVGLLNNGPPVRATARLAAARRVYESRAGRDLGLTAEWPVELADGETKLYALLPAAAAAPEVDTTRAAAGRETVLSAAQTGAAGRVLYLAVTDATGRARAEYGGAAVVAANGTAVWRLTPALNDPPGRWRLRVTDVATGLAGDGELEVSR